MRLHQLDSATLLLQVTDTELEQPRSLPLPGQTSLPLPGQDPGTPGSSHQDPPDPPSTPLASPGLPTAPALHTSQEPPAPRRPDPHPSEGGPGGRWAAKKAPGLAALHLGGERSKAGALEAGRGISLGPGRGISAPSDTDSGIEAGEPGGDAKIKQVRGQPCSLGQPPNQSLRRPPSVLRDPARSVSMRRTARSSNCCVSTRPAARSQTGVRFLQDILRQLIIDCFKGGPGKQTILDPKDLS